MMAAIRKTIDLKWLEKRGACRPAKDWFVRQFGKTARVPIRKVVLAGHASGEDSWWLLPLLLHGSPHARKWERDIDRVCNHRYANAANHARALLRIDLAAVKRYLAR